MAIRKSFVDPAVSRRRNICLTGLTGLTALLFVAYASGEAPPPEGAGPAVAGTERSGADPRSAEFQEAAIGSAAFAEAASRQGIVADPEEVARYVEAYRKLYPGKIIDPANVKCIVLAEKYLAAKGLGTGDEDAERAVAKRWDPSRYPTEAEAEQAKKAIRIQILLGGENAKRESSKLEDLGHLHREERLKPTPMFEPIEIQLPGDPAACLAWSGSDCFVTVGEYNAACTQYQFPAGLGADSAKSSVLRRYVLEKRRAELARGQGLDQRPDSIVARAQERRARDVWMRSAMRYGMPVHDMPRLQAAYDKYYSRYFAARRKMALEVIGSTDSAFMDSLHGAYAAWEKSTGARNPAGNGKAREPRLPWTDFDAQDLPVELRAAAERLRIGGVSRPFRTPYGHFLIRLKQVVRMGEIPINRAFSQLTFLATRDKFIDMDSVVEAKARRFYAENQARYAVPDTMELRAWLIPGPGRPVAAEPGGKGNPPVLADTLRTKAAAVSSLALPEEIRIRLQQAVREDSAKTFIGPLTDRFGRWYFKVLSRRPSHRVLPFRLARKDILERISAPLQEVGRGLASEESISEVQLNMGLSEAYLREELRKTTTQNADGVEMPGPEIPPAPDIPSEEDHAKAIAREAARMEEERARFRREEAMLMGNTRMDLSVLFGSSRGR